MPVEEIRISPQTGLVAIFGHPVGIRCLPGCTTQPFGTRYRHGLPSFRRFPERLSSAVEGLRALGMRGANVTVPHKEAVVHLLDEVEPLAARIGAVNTIVNDDGRLSGHNTDVSGFAAALHSVLPQGRAGWTAARRRRWRCAVGYRRPR